VFLIVDFGELGRAENAEHGVHQKERITTAEQARLTR
jgi:hypothetical protein